MSAFHFAGLTPDLILDAIESVGIRVESGLLALNSYENRVYQFVGLHESDSTARFVVKFYRPNRWNQAQLQEEHDFAHELQTHEIPIVAPIKFDNHSLLNYQGFYFAIYPSAGGRQFEVDNLDQLEWMGRFLGRIHQVSASKPFTHRPSLSIDSHVRQPIATLKQCQMLPPHLETVFFSVLEQFEKPIVERYQPNIETDYIRLHGDCHASNILWNDGPSFVDLDDCRMGPAVQDVWMMLSGDINQQQLQLDTLLEAYEEFSTFDSKQLKLIEPLRAMRMVHYMAWLATRWEDPAFQLAFPWFADHKYWENQILGFKEQLAALYEEPIRRIGQ